MLDKPQWKVAYQGETTYLWRGRWFNVRYRATRHLNGVWAPYVGTVSNAHNSDTFPDPALVALFPGFVGARYNPDTKSTEYAGGALPQLIETADGWQAIATLPDFDRSARNPCTLV